MCVCREVFVKSRTFHCENVRLFFGGLSSEGQVVGSVSFAGRLFLCGREGRGRRLGLCHGLLRGELGFDGVVLTESLRALGVTNFYAPGEAAVLAVQAGADMLFLSADPDAAAQGILRALQTGEISRERLDESVERILALKIASGLIR